MCESAAHRRLAGAGRPVQQYAAFGAQAKPIRQLVILERQDDVDLEAAQHVVHAFQIFQVHLLHFPQVHIAGQALRAEILDEQISRQVFGFHKPLARRF